MRFVENGYQGRPAERGKRVTTFGQSVSVVATSRCSLVELWEQVFPGHHLARMPDTQVLDLEPPALTGRLTVAMAVAAGFAAANVWYNQPMLGVIAADLHAPTQLVALIPTATQIGFASGMLLLVPLGDRMDRRTLILRQLAWLSFALLAAAAAPGPVALIAASAGVGLGAGIAQQIIPFAAELAAPERRGRVVGLVMSGLLTGILSARVLSGAVAEHFGWRAMFLLAAGFMVATGVLLARMLPRSRPSTGGSYGGLLLSVLALARAHPRLRRATLVQAALFGGFSAFWSFLALRLAAPPFALGSDIAGLFGLLGAASVAAATLAGRRADRHGPRGVIGAGALMAAAGFAVLAAWPTLAGIIVGLLLIDVGVQSAQIGNQTVIYALQPDARGRMNTVFMTGMFVGGAIASGVAGFGWVHAGWPAVCAVGFVLSAFALAVHLTGPQASSR